MLTGEQIIYVANDWFAENKTSAHHIAEVLATSNRILYVEAAGQRAPRSTSKRDIKKVVTKLRKAWAKPKRITDGFFLTSPLILPLHRYAVVRRLNRLLLARALKRACRIAGFDRPILWIFLPHYAPIIGSVSVKGLVYYCVDEYSSQPNVETQVIQQMEQEVLDRADVVFAVSEELTERKRRSNPNTYLSLHGVDIERFEQAHGNGVDVAADIRDIPAPIAGFFGLIEEWIDLELIHDLATRLPAVSFVFVGRVAQNVEKLRKLANVYFLGQRNYNELPGYLKAFDVCLLPYKLNTQVINSNPKKLREYLAGGKPVVSVRVREVERYAEQVYIADDYDSFADCIERALREDNTTLAESRMSAVKNESWQARVQAISNHVCHHIPGVNNE